MVNSQIPLLTGQPSVDIELLQNNVLSTPVSGGWNLRIYHAPKGAHKRTYRIKSNLQTE